MPDPITSLTCYQIDENAPRIVPARPERAWMDATNVRYAYRCLPLSIANSMGWELLCPMPIEATWNGGAELADISVVGRDGANVEGFAQSHFGHGVLTFQTRYLFRTDPGVALWVRGSPNRPKDGIAPLDGLVETDWLDFTFTMNWMFTRPGTVSFEKDEPFCFIMPVGYHALDGIQPVIRPLADNPELHHAYHEYGRLRREFNAGLAARTPEIVREAWQKWYMRGVHPDGTPGNPAHMSKLRLAEPRLESGLATAAAVQDIQSDKKED